MSPDPVDTAAPADAKSPVSDEPSLRRQVVRGSMHTIGFYGMTHVLRLAGNVACAHFLAPAHFAVMSVCFVVLEGIELFSDIGIRPAIVHSPLGHDPDFLNTAWTIQVVRGVVLWLIACALGPAVAQIYPEYPEAAGLLPVIGFAAVLSGLWSTKLHTALKSMRPIQVLVSQLAGQVAAVTCMVIVASIYQSVWALVIGGLISPFVQVLFSHLLLPGVRNRLHWNADHARALFRYGRWVFLSTVFTFLARQTDRLVLAGLIGKTMFGVYNQALMGARICIDVVGQLVDWVAFPAYARIVNSGDSVQQPFRRMNNLVQLGAGALVAALIAGGPGLVRVLFDWRYHDAGWMLRLLAMGGWFAVLESGCSSLHKALASTRWMAAGHSTKVATMVIALPLGYHLDGLEGALVGGICADITRYIVCAIGLERRGFPIFRHDMLTTAAVVATASLGVYIDSHMFELPPFVRMASSGAAAACLWLVPLGMAAAHYRRK